MSLSLETGVRAGFGVLSLPLEQTWEIISGPLFSGPLNGNNGWCLQLLQKSNAFLLPEC